jgi:hypothetical protein
MTHRLTDAGPSGWRRSWSVACATWGLAATSYLAVNAAFWTITRQDAPPLGHLLDVWYRYDTVHYLTIASDGYDPAGQRAAFFPLYPLLVRYVDAVLPGHGLAAALVVASMACVVALAFIHRLVQELSETQTAARAVFYLMASPFAFYLVAAYNESLFVALCAGSLYFMHRGRWWAAGLLAGFASGTRYFGVILALPFVIEYLRQRDWQWRRIRWDATAIALAPTGLVAYMAYCASRWGDPWLFARLQETGWGHKLSPPWTGIVDGIRQISGAAPLSQTTVLNVVDLLAALVGAALLVLGVVGPWRLGPASWYLVAFGAAELLGVLMSPIVMWLPPLHGLPRYALEMVPIFLVLARMGADRRIDRAYLFPALVVQTSLLIAFFSSVYLS